MIFWGIKELYERIINTFSRKGCLLISVGHHEMTTKWHYRPRRNFNPLIWMLCSSLRRNFIFTERERDDFQCRTHYILYRGLRIRSIGIVYSSLTHTHYLNFYTHASNTNFWVMHHNRIYVICGLQCYSDQMGHSIIKYKWETKSFPDKHTCKQVVSTREFPFLSSIKHFSPFRKIQTRINNNGFQLLQPRASK